MKRGDVTPMTQLELAIPQTWRARLDLYLYSDLEGRIPKGAYKTFFLNRLVEFFTFKRLDLTPWGLPGAVTGPEDSIAAIRQLLSKETPRV